MKYPLSDTKMSDKAIDPVLRDTPCIMLCEFADLELNESHGLYVFDDVIDGDTEFELAQLTKTSEDPTQIVRTRITTHLGKVFDHTTLRVAKEDATEIPSEYTSALDTIFFHTARTQSTDKNRHILQALCRWPYDQITVNRYPHNRRTGIGTHVDTHSEFDDCIAVISLGSATEIQFMLPESYENADLPEKVRLWLRPRSLMIMSGMSRYLYRHRIPVRVTDIDPNGNVAKREERISITVRKIRNSVCDCAYPISCDSQNPSSFTMPTRLNDAKEQRAKINVSSPASVE